MSIQLKLYNFKIRMHLCNYHQDGEVEHFWHLIKFPFQSVTMFFHSQTEALF